MSARDIIAICQRQLGQHSNDCSGFVKAVADACGVLLVGNANRIASTLDAGRRLPNGLAAHQAAAQGDLVIAGVHGDGHGHVVVVVDGPVGLGKYPYAFWGRIHEFAAGGVKINAGFTRGHGTLNFAFSSAQLPLIAYAAFTPVESLFPPLGPNEGRLLPAFASPPSR